jgi:arylsulfatase A-like enzyme
METRFILRTIRLWLWLVPALSLTPAITARAGDDPRPAAAAPARHVLIISVDGLRPDAINASETRHLPALIRAGAYCARAQTIRPPITLPSHTSMLTGLTYERHGVTWNHYRDGWIRQPTVFSVAKQAGLTTAMLFAKDKLRYLVVPDMVDFVHGEIPPGAGRLHHSDTHAAGIAATFARSWEHHAWALTFIHFAEPDVAGHRHGWMSERYLKSVAVTDEAIGVILDAIKTSGRLDRTAIIVTSDHGGSGHGHSKNIPENYTIPWICVGPGVTPGLTIDRVVHIYDTAPTALALLGLSAPPGIDGKAVREVLTAPVPAPPPDTP